MPVKATKLTLDQLKEKLGVDVPEQIILGACRPVLAYAALLADPSVATLMPCNVVVRMTDLGAVVEAVDPDVMSRMSPDEAVGRVGRDAADRLRAALESLPGQAPVIASVAFAAVVQPVG